MPERDHTRATNTRDTRWIVIPRWEKFQHRDAARSTLLPWIKVWTRLLHDEAYLALTGHRRAILHGLWLEYATSRRCIAHDTATISRRLALRVTTADLEALNHAGFIRTSASRPAGRHAGADTDREGERDEEAADRTAVARDPANRAARKSTSRNRLEPDLLAELLELTGTDRRTPAVLRTFANRGLPEAAFRNALEATREARTEHRLRGTEIAYLIGTLQQFESNRQYRP